MGDWEWEAVVKSGRLWGRNKGPEVIFLSPALCLAVSQNYVPLNTFPIHPFLNPLWSRQTLLQVVVEFIAVSFLSWLLLSWHLWIHVFLCMPQSESFDRKRGGHHLLLVHMNIDQKERSDKLTHKGKITLYDHKTHTKHLQPGKPGQILIIAKFSLTDWHIRQCLVSPCKRGSLHTATFT